MVMRLALFLAILAASALDGAVWAADVKVNVSATAPDEGQAVVTLNTTAKTWTGKNTSGSAVLKTPKGKYVAGPLATPGFAVEGVALIKDGMNGTDKDSLDAYLFGLKPADANSRSGDAQMPGTGEIGSWKR
jgi:hypothetical protein